MGRKRRLKNVDVIGATIFMFIIILINIYSIYNTIAIWKINKKLNLPKPIMLPLLSMFAIIFLTLAVKEFIQKYL